LERPRGARPGGLTPSAALTALGKMNDPERQPTRSVKQCEFSDNAEHRATWIARPRKAPCCAEP